MAVTLHWQKLIIFAFVCKNTAESSESDPYNSTNARLIRDLLARYQRHVRPVLHPADSITVSIYGAPYQIINVDQKRNLISISAHFEMSWQDAYLRWKPEDYENADHALLPASTVWTPEVFVYYSTDKKSVIESVLNVKVNYTGHVHSFVPFTTETICPIDVKHFPFDEQHCTLLFDTWPPNGDGVHLSINGGGKNLNVGDDFYDSQEWMLKNFSLLYENTSSKTNMVAMHLDIERQSFYYIFNLVVPSALISVVSIVGFHLPSASIGGRLSKSRLGMMTLLSMSVLLLSVVNELPKFAFEAVPGKKGSFSSIPLIGIYYFSLLAIISMATITSSWIVVLEKQVIREGVPFYLRWLVVEQWPCWKGRCNRRHSAASGERPNVGYEPASAKAVVRNERQKRASAETLELADLCEGRENDSPQAHANSSKTAREQHYSNQQHEAQAPSSVEYAGNILEIYKDIRTHMAESLEVLRAMKSVLAEPLAQSSQAEAGLVVRRLEEFCLTVYLFLVFLVLLMFFRWRGWYG